MRRVLLSGIATIGILAATGVAAQTQPQLPPQQQGTPAPGGGGADQQAPGQGQQQRQQPAGEAGQQQGQRPAGEAAGQQRQQAPAAADAGQQRQRPAAGEAQTPAGQQGSGQANQGEPGQAAPATGSADGQPRQRPQQADSVPERSEPRAGGGQQDQRPAPAQRVEEPGADGPGAEQAQERQQAPGASQAPQQETAGEPRRQPDGQAREQATPGAGDQTGTTQGAAQQQGRDQAPQQDAGRAAGGDRPVRAISENAQISAEERTRVTSAFTRADVEPVRDLDVRISVGVRLPDRVRLYDVPSEVIAVVPQYRGYRYTIVENQVVIVEPQTLEVVDVVPVTGSTRATASTTRGSINLSAEQRTTIVSTLRESGEGFRAGSTVPACVQLQPMPETVEVQELRSYSYFVAGEEVILVDPNTREVVEVLN